MVFELKAPFAGVGVVVEASEVETAIRYTWETLWPLKEHVEQRKKALSSLPEELRTKLPDDALSRVIRTLNAELAPLIATDSISLDAPTSESEITTPLQKTDTLTVTQDQTLARSWRIIVALVALAIGGFFILLRLFRR